MIQTPKNLASKELMERMERVTGKQVQVKVTCPDATIHCKGLDAITKAEIRTTIKKQCDFEGGEMTVPTLEKKTVQNARNVDKGFCRSGI